MRFWSVPAENTTAKDTLLNNTDSYNKDRDNKNNDHLSNLRTCSWVPQCHTIYTGVESLLQAPWEPCSSQNKKLPKVIFWFETVLRRS